MTNRPTCWRLVAWFGALILALGCVAPRAPQVMDLAGPDWTLRQGQAVWQLKPEGPGVAGELTVATHPDGRSLVQFVKPPLLMATAQRTSNSWHVQFPADHKAYSGRGRPPSRLLWLQFTDALAGGHTDTNWFLARKPDGSWHFENLTTEEALEGFLTTTQLPATHLVRSGDTLQRIARWYGVTQESIRETNAILGSAWFKPGNVIRLPVLTGQATSPTSPP